MYNELTLILGTDISVPTLGLSMHQPTLAEIAMIGEERFFNASRFLNLTKKDFEEDLTEEDKSLLEEQSNFDIIMSIMNEESDIMARQNRVNTLLLLTLIFPKFRIRLEKDCLLLIPEGDNEDAEEGVRSITKYNYEYFLENFNIMFCMSDFIGTKSNDYNPANETAKKLMEKFKEREKRLAELRGADNGDKVAIFSRYVSILSMGQKKDLNSFRNYTVFQLMDEYERYNLKTSNDIYLKAQLAGATGLDEVDNWMKDIHPASK